MGRTLASSELISKMSALKDEAWTAKQTVHSNWDYAWQFYNGDQWQGAKFPIAWTAEEKCTINLLKSTINTILPIVCDALPTWYVKAYAPENDDNADLLSRFLQGLWFDQRLDRGYNLAIKDALVTGTGAMKVYLSQMTHRVPLPTGGKDGRVDAAYLDPYSIFPDPNAQNIEDCRYLAIKTPMPASLLKHFYPSADLKAMDDELQGERRGQWYKDTKNDSEEQRYDVWEVYHEFGHKLTIYSGSEILFDGDSPVQDGRFPVVLFLDDERGTDMWGGGIIDNGGSELQKAVNKIVWRILCHARVCVNPRLVQEGLGTVKMTNDPGGLIQMNSPTAKLRPLETPPLPPYVFSLLEMILGLWDTMTGVHDVTQGQRPQGVQSGAAILRLQEAGQTRIRQLIRNWSLQLGEVGQLVLDFMQAYYTGPQNTFQMKQSGPERVSFVAEQVLTDPVGGPIPYRVVTQPQADLPLSQGAWAELVMQLAAIPWPDPQLQKMVFNLLRIPGRYEYFQDKQEAALAQVQQSRQMELEAGMHGMAEQQTAGSPEPGAPDNSNLDFMAMLAAQSGAGQQPMGGGPGAVPE